MMLLLAGFTACDAPVSTENKPNPETAVQQFFSFNPDSIGPMLEIAIDTLRTRQTNSPFIKEFLVEQGLPVWDFHSSFISQGQPVFLIPVKDISRPTVTGIIYISIEKSQPIYRWIDRTANLEEAPKLTPKALKTFILVYEKLIFGRVSSPNVKVKTQSFTKEVPKQEGNIAYEWVLVKNKHHCGNTSVDGGASWGPDQCEIDYRWVWVEGPRNPRVNDPNDGDEEECTFGCGGGGGGGSNIGGSESEAEAFEDRIIMEELASCMKYEMRILTFIHEGVGSIVQDFAIDELNPDIANLNWEVKDGDLDPNKNAITLTQYDSGSNTVTTIFDSEKFVNATDLAVAETMLHEAVHAWVVSITFTGDLTLAERHALLGDNWIRAYENQGHNFMATDYVTRIADGLKAFGDYMGYNLSRQFYEDMAWRGLYRTPEFENLSAQEQKRIKDIGHAEQYGTDTNGNYQPQKGEDAGC